MKFLDDQTRLIMRNVKGPVREGALSALSICTASPLAAAQKHVTAHGRNGMPVVESCHHLVCRVHAVSASVGNRGMWGSHVAASADRADLKQHTITLCHRSDNTPTGHRFVNAGDILTLMESEREARRLR